MALDLAGGDLVAMTDLTPETLRQILDTADVLKAERQRGQPHPLLVGRSLAMIFQKPSTRTRVSFETGMAQLGGQAITLNERDIGIGTRESVEDIALVLSRYCDLITARVRDHETVTELARHATVPVINALSDVEHPLQTLADLQTIREKKGRLREVRVTWVGDGNNVCHSLMYGCAMSGARMTVVTPPGYEPDQTIRSEVEQIAWEHGGSLSVTDDVTEGVRDAEVVYTDVWTSMGQEEEAQERRERFRGYQVDERMMGLTDPRSIVMHCLPAHYGEEIAYETSRRPGSAIFDQAENRLHTQKAVLVLLAGRHRR